MNIETNKKKAQKVTIIGGIVNIVLSILKMIFGVMFNSTALIVDSLHSLSDVVTDIFVLIVARFSHEKPDKKHPYGHGRFETMGTVVLGTILIGFAMVLAWENSMRLYEGTNLKIPAWPALVGAAISIVAKEWVFRITYKVGKEIKSPMIIANAWHSRSDAFSSIAVFVGIGFSLLGILWLDSFMAIVVSIMIGKVGWDFLWNSIKELVDTSLDDEKTEDIYQTIMAVDGVKSCHNLRSRKMGEEAIIDVNVDVGLGITASEGHEISSWVAKMLIDNFEEITDVTVHTDVEDDRVDGVSFDSYHQNLLPLRPEVLKNVHQKLHGYPFIKDASQTRLHYHGHFIILEFVLSKEDQKHFHATNLLDEINSICDEIEWLKQIDVMFDARS